MLESLVAGEGRGGISKPSWRTRGMAMGAREAGDCGAGVGFGADVEAADAVGVGVEAPRGDGRGSDGDLAVSRGFSAEALGLMGGAGFTGDWAGSSSSAIGLASPAMPVSACLRSNRKGGVPHLACLAFCLTRMPCLQSIAGHVCMA